jgi:hypothetical protein
MDVTEAGPPGSSLALALGLFPGARFTVVNPPEGLGRWLMPLPSGVVYQEMTDEEPLDLALVFAASQRQLTFALSKIRLILKPGAPVWLSWTGTPSAEEERCLQGEGLRELQRLPIGADFLARKVLLLEGASPSARQWS